MQMFNILPKHLWRDFKEWQKPIKFHSIKIAQDQLMTYGFGLEFQDGPGTAPS